MLMCQKNGFCYLIEGHGGPCKPAPPKDNWDLPVLILAVSKEAGEKYAEVLRVPNYRVETEIQKIQGRPIRSVIVSPGYLEAARTAFYDKMDAYGAAMQTASLHTTDLG
jgi:hypothetical protein